MPVYHFVGRNFQLITVPLVVTLGTIALISCGGSGGSQTNGPVNLGFNCLASFQPNYATSILNSTDVNVKGALLHFKTFPITVAFTRDANWTQARQDLASAAFQTWPAANGGLVLSFINDTTNADISVQFVPQSDLGGLTLGLTQGSFTKSTNQLIKSTMQLAYDQADGDLSRVCAHEFGHALGIQGHSPTISDLMYYALAPSVPNGPTANDSNTLAAVYCGSYASRSKPVPTDPSDIGHFRIE